MKVRQMVLALSAGALVLAPTTATTPAHVIPKAAVTTGACTSAFMSPDIASPGTLGATITFTASATTCTNPEFEFYLQKPHGSWVAVTAYGSATWAWNTTGLKGGVYGVGVWARDAGSTAAYEAYWIGTYTLPLLNCSTAEVSTTEYRVIPPGVTNHISGSACQGALIRFWLKRPYDSFRMVRDYSTDNVWAWNTQGYPDGTYLVGIWARQPGSPKAYDTYAIGTFLIGGPGTLYLGLTPRQSSPQAPGTILYFDVAPNSSLYFAYWLKPPGGPWIHKAYSSDPSTDWDTTGYANGTYQIGVWAKPASSNLPYTAFGVITVQLDVGQCTSVALTPDVASPQEPGATITFTAATPSGDCTSPNYEFWLLPSPNQAWVLERAYGTGPTFVVNTTGAPRGPIRIGVWAGQTGSTASFDTYAILTFWIGS